MNKEDLIHNPMTGAHLTKTGAEKAVEILSSEAADAAQRGKKIDFPEFEKYRPAFLDKGGFFMKRFAGFMFLAYICICFSGCSYRSWYEGLMETERQNCYKIENRTERQECLDSVGDMSYDQYQKEREISD
ncbi:MAG: hypothetical protein V2I97_24820 [Desulfococcaceae bacterium]|jgi:hypothetical protein|nr:hypothetical protein [Desulfococcaceae bacterium]